MVRGECLLLRNEFRNRSTSEHCCSGVNQESVITTKVVRQVVPAHGWFFCRERDMWHAHSVSVIKLDVGQTINGFAKQTVFLTGRKAKPNPMPTSQAAT